MNFKPAKKLEVKKWKVWLLITLVFASLAYLVASKYEVYKFATLHSQETVMCEQRYNQVAKSAQLLFADWTVPVK